MMVKKAVLYSLAAVIAVLVVLFVLRLTPAWDAMLPPGAHRRVDFATLTLGDKTNVYLVCPPGLCANAEAHLQSPRFALSAAELRAAFEKIALAEPAVTKIGGGGGNLDLLQRTPLMRWPDWIAVKFIALEDGGSTLALYSRSVYGSKDFGANEARIADWLAKLSAATD